MMKFFLLIMVILVVLLIARFAYLYHVDLMNEKFENKNKQDDLDRNSQIEDPMYDPTELVEGGSIQEANAPFSLTSAIVLKDEDSL